MLRKQIVYPKGKEWIHEALAKEARKISYQLDKTVSTNEFIVSIFKDHIELLNGKEHKKKKNKSKKQPQGFTSYPKHKSLNRKK